MMDFKGASITKITVNLGGQEVELTLDQARELHKVLHEMFGKDSPCSPSPNPWTTPWTMPQMPNHPVWTVTRNTLKVNL